MSVVLLWDRDSDGPLDLLRPFWPCYCDPVITSRVSDPKQQLIQSQSKCQLCHEGQTYREQSSLPSPVARRGSCRLFLHHLRVMGGLIYPHSLILYIAMLRVSVKSNFSPLPCFFGACTKQLSLKFLEVLCNLSNSREHLGVQYITKSNNSNNNNNNNSEAMKAQGCCDFEHTVVLFWKGLLRNLPHQTATDSNMS